LWTGGEGYERVKRILIEEYGWGKEFKEEEWRRDCERIWHECENRGIDGDQMTSTTAEEVQPKAGYWSRYGCWQQ
jgi:hypothetical protein